MLKPVFHILTTGFAEKFSSLAIPMCHSFARYCTTWDKHWHIKVQSLQIEIVHDFEGYGTIGKQTSPNEPEPR